MRKIEWFWNLVYYNLYRFYLKVNKLFRCLNPFYWFNKIPAVKRHHAKHGIDDMNEFMIRTINDPKDGMGTSFVGSWMGGLLVFTEIGIYNVMGGSWEYIGKDGFHVIIYLLFLLVTIVIINQHLLFRKDKYLIYFEEFKKMTNKEKTNYGWLTFFVVILIFSFAIGSAVFRALT